MKLRFAFALLLLVAACAHGGSTTGDHTYGADAKENYDLGIKELESKNWLEAERYLSFTSAKFPYSGYSALADLALADLDFQQEKYVEAVEKYKNFIKLHPTHPKDGYASFQIALSYYEQMPGDFFLLPNSAEKDQTEARSALSAFNEFLTQFPSSELRPQALEKVADLKHRLADHEMRIAQFYFDHDRPRAAAGRYETVLRDYAGSGFEGDAASRLVRAYDKLGEPAKAKDALEKFVKDHPDDPQVAQVRKALGQG